MKKLVLILVAVLAIAYTSQAQKTAFTPKDVLGVKSFSISDMTDDGNFIAGTIRTRKDRMNTNHKRFGDPNYVGPGSSNLVIINTKTGEKVSVPGPMTSVRGVRWSPDDSNLAYLVYEAGHFNLCVYDNAKAKKRQIKLKSDLKIASNSGLDWTPDGTSVIISLRSENWAEKGDSLFKEATIGPTTIYDSNRPFLKWDELRNYSSLVIPARVTIKSGEVLPLLSEGRYSNMTLSEEDNKLTFVEYVPKKTVYDRKGGTDYGLYVLDLNNPANIDTLQKKSEKRLSLNWNEKKTSFAYADSSHIYVRSIFEEEAVKISSDTMEIVKKDTAEAKFSVNRWSPDGQSVLASTKKGYWLIDIETKDMKLVYEFPEDNEKAPEKRIISWSPGGESWYMSYSARDKWERGLVRYDIESRQFTDLIKDENLYSSWRMTRDGSKFFYNYSDGNLPNELYLTDKDFKSKKQLIQLNPWIENKKLTRSELISYRDSDGKELFGILYYPVDYESGKEYPLVCEIYEKFFNNGYSYSMNLIANAGYFGFKPSVNLIEGYPGEAWIKGITAGINKLIEMGLVDEDKLGVHGTSYGGYATSLLISQTDRFAAAINISGKTNIISFLGDSPRIGTRNYAAAEVGQDRIGETLWDAPMKYYATSAVMFADRINTPHLLLTGEGDWNVPALNTRELYYAMRRLGKEVVWINYYNGGHGAGNASDEADFYDHWNRIIEWYETHFEKERE